MQVLNDWFSATVKLYINGVLEDNGSSIVQAGKCKLRRKSGVWQIGHISGQGAGTGRQYEGDIDEVAIWNDELSKRRVEIRALYNSGEQSV